MCLPSPFRLSFLVVRLAPFVSLMSAHLDSPAIEIDYILDID